MKWDFDAFMHQVLTHAPRLTKSHLQVKIRRLDEEDSRSSLFPTLSLYATHFVSTGTNVGISTNAYRPFESYFSLKARKIITEIAKIAHIRALSEACYEAAQAFFRLAYLDQLRVIQQELVSKAKKRRAYVWNRYHEGVVTRLALLVADQTLAVREAELKGLDVEKGAIVDALAVLADLPNRNFTIITSENRKIIPDTDPGVEDIENFLKTSPQFRVAKFKEQLQQWNIRVAHAAYLPTFSLAFRRPDVLSEGKDGNDNYVFGVGARFPIWDGRRRHRNIIRQKIVLEQFEAETRLKETDLTAAWHSVLSNLHQAGAKMEIAQTEEKLSALKLARARVRYARGEILMPALIDQEVAHRLAIKKKLKKRLTFDLARLQIHHLYGSLFRRHINVINLRDTPHEKKGYSPAPLLADDGNDSPESGSGVGFNTNR